MFASHDPDERVQLDVLERICGHVYLAIDVAAITSISIALCSPPSMLSLRSTPRSAGPSGMDGGCAQRTTSSYSMAGYRACIGRYI